MNTVGNQSPAVRVYALQDDLSATVYVATVLLHTAVQYLEGLGIFRERTNGTTKSREKATLCLSLEQSLEWGNQSRG